MNPWKSLVLTFPLALVAACTDGSKGPAESAMTAAGAAMEALKGDAVKYAPNEVKKLESVYGVAKDSMANKDYQGALTFAKDIPAKVTEVLAKAEASKADLAKAWTASEASIGKAVDAAKHRLSGSKKTPPGLDKAAVDRARSELSALETGWTAATAQFESGDWSGAVARAKELDARGQALLKSLGTQ